ncbi:low affinity potassium transporter Kup [Chromobacterium subtsugae]|uniref:Probable potassium transport system protein Kup n=1 Tax=Chromobacterium subtsugae TaxID=251747 RepID=A0ABS7FG67_9NEIS|nr:MULTISPECIES: low affinity potassium transporter Kup [Chromobacterium]KUM03881.1 potassium transport protein Kup [Chromobacterium subtsugae]KZE87458.1 potassium transport protein Kup [Chromobacterium sp. F49]MBW7566607.1 low affinity potassium transporter Kup [Chromobacterium subtsugae]MBW8288294.1 low affinity potassium transporter Kup [Chromobacterium subtsugae]OBU87257.1 potassium transport protein Kup [Chromobacterium subtsugae]
MQDHNKQAMAGLTLAALGVVYGDIGTSPLYTLRECFVSQSIPTTPDNIFGILSLIFWSLIFVVSIKYVAFVLRADNRGEGGIMALMALARHYTTHAARWKIVMLGLFGAALFYGDAIITPAVSVLSAAEGMEVISSGMEAYVLPVAVGVLVGLFLLQKHGTASVGLLFGPVMMVWFAILGILGLNQILQQPAVLQALNPWHAFAFLHQHGFHAFLTLGSVVLALTGAEALYADMGHFGKTPIRRAWFALVLPGLALNYFGQGALLMRDPAAIKNPFFLLAPDWALLPMIVLATLATVIASQAVISGAYSLTRQAILLGYCPRLEVNHTSEKEIGQIYMPFINWALLIAVLVVVLTFKSSSSLAAAYGIAVTGTMLITTMLFFVVARVNWRWPLPLALGITLLFGVIDTAFFAANIHKVADGGWLPLVMGMAIFTLMSTWKLGRELLFKRLREQALPLDGFIQNLEAYPPARVEGTAVFLTSTLHGVPHALLHNLKHNKVLHERVVLMTVRTEDVPYVAEDERLEVVQMSASFWRVVARYGFKEDPNVLQVMEMCAKEGFELELMDTSFFLSRETIVPTERPGMARWREKLFVWMSKNAMRATDFFQVPTNRVVELGAQVEL